MKILFFIDSLRTGGKERRLIELLFYLKNYTTYEMALVLTDDTISYSYIKDLQIPIYVIRRRLIKYDPSIFFRFLKIAREFKPNIIHSWGMMATGYAIPAKIVLKSTLLANLIADAKKKESRSFLSNLFWKLDFKFADIILGNSEAGFQAYNLHTKKKIKLIYNGVRLERFSNSLNIAQIKKDLNIHTSYVAIMVASTSQNKDYDFLLDLAKSLQLTRPDLVFVGVGGGNDFERLQYRLHSEKIENVILTGKRNDVETLIAAADIGLLFTYSEGVSNSIIEYMAMGKPVITTDIFGGSREIIENGVSGYIMQRNIEEIKAKVTELLDDEALRWRLGQQGKEVVQQKFSVERMGREYVTLYENTIKSKIEI